ncbi:MAG TPA: hypothetical protein VHO72_02465 [Bacteroidales bacterium]|nr:hypothetical protein [Bacteroidales bacterium]
MRFVIGLILFIHSTAIVLAGESFTPNCRQALYHILNLDFAKANAYIHNESQVNPSSIYIPYLQNYSDFVNIAINEDPSTIASYANNFEERVTSIERNSADNNEKQWMLSEMYLQSSVLYGKLNLKLAALRHLYTAEKYLARYAGYKTRDAKTARLLPVVWLVNLYMPGVIKKMLPISEQTPEKAFSMLNEYRRQVASDTLLTLEADILTAFLINQFGKEYKASCAELLPKVEKSGYSALFSLSGSLLAVRAGNSNEALRILSNYRSKVKQPYYFYYYLTGELKTNLGRGGEEDFKYFLKNYKGKNYVKAAWLKLGWNYLEKSDTLAYRNCMQNAISKGVKWVEADIYVNSEALKGTIPNKNLLRARLFFDAGLYSQAKEVMLKDQTIQSLASTQQQLEYIYRQARIDHALGEITLAKRYYKQVVQLGKDYPYYFAAYSALQLGIISESERDIASAKSYYDTCLKLNKYEYSGSIEAKAREGIRRITQ